MSQEAAVLFANEAFYLAFATRDVKSMNELWSEKSSVTCVHPGWRPLIGREDVVESWLTLLGNPAAPHVEFRDARAFIYGQTATVLCFEVMREGILVATNIFVHEETGWRMVHHHATPVAEQIEFEEQTSQPGRMM